MGRTAAARTARTYYPCRPLNDPDTGDKVSRYLYLGWLVLQLGHSLVVVGEPGLDPGEHRVVTDDFRRTRLTDRELRRPLLRVREVLTLQFPDLRLHLHDLVFLGQALVLHVAPS